MLSLQHKDTTVRKMKFISPTSYSAFCRNREEFYLMYLSDNKPAKIPQTQPMAIGSAFDVFIKHHLAETLGLQKFDFDETFNKQIENPAIRDWAKENGKYIFDCYVRSGAVADLLFEMKDYSGTPKMEFGIEGTIRGVPIYGKPDLWFINSAGAHVIMDWKVNGYCSKNPASPAVGYTKCRDGWDHSLLSATPTHNRPHKDAQLILSNGVMVNVATTLERIKLDWAVQLAIYSWVLGEEIGGDFITAIEQITGRNVDGFNRPFLRAASFRVRINRDWQVALADNIEKMWGVVNTDWIFDDIPHEESLAKQALLDKQAGALAEGGDWFSSVTRG